MLIEFDQTPRLKVFKPLEYESEHEKSTVTRNLRLRFDMSIFRKISMDISVIDVWTINGRSRFYGHKWASDIKRPQYAITGSGDKSDNSRIIDIYTLNG